MTFIKCKSTLRKEYEMNDMEHTENFTMTIHSFLEQIVHARKKVEENCSCERCTNLPMFPVINLQADLELHH